MVRTRTHRFVYGAAWLLAMLPGFAFAEANAEWDHPNWARPFLAYEGRFRAETGEGDLVCRYRYPSGEMGEAALRPDAANSEWTHFRVPAPPESPDGELTFWIADPGQDASPDTTRSVPYADGADFYVSGNTGIDLFYPLEEWGLLLVFRPCCFIDGGILNAFRLPGCPYPDAEGAPKSPLSPYFSIEPDDLTIATAGLRAEIAFNTEGLDAVDASTVAVYQWSGDAWTETPNVEIDSAEKKAKFKCVKGGLFVVARRTD